MENGAGACCFSTGMAATVTCFSSFLKAGDHCVLTSTSYGGTNRVARVQFQDFGIEFSFIDMTDPKNVEAAIKPNTKLVFSETPANPTMTINDIDAISAICKAKGILHACDTTFATPYILKGLDHGADLVVQSTTKFYDGHNITVGGAIVSSTKELDDRVHFVQNMHGNIMSPQVAFYQLQTSKTMHLRIKQQSASCQAIAEFLEKHPLVESVKYPGLKSFPQKELADRLHRNGVHGSMLNFEVKGGTAAGRALMNAINRPWSLCENLGATE